MSPSGAGAYCVVGGGISGLVAAYRIRAAVGADATITLFDPGDRLGGVLRTEVLSGQPVDIGAEAFVARRPEIPALLAELGLADRQIATTGVRPTIYSRGRMHPLPPGAVNGIPSSAQSVTGLVDDATVARIAEEPGRPLRWQRGSDPAVGAVVAERFGDQVVRRCVDPMLSGVYAGSADTIGIRSAVPAVAAALDAGADSLTVAVRQAVPAENTGAVFGAIAGGYRVLLEQIIARSGLCWVPCAVERIDRDGAGWAVSGGGDVRHADGVVIATPARQAGELLATTAPAAAAAAARIPHASSAVLAMSLPIGTVLPSHSGVLVATGEPLHAKAITLSSRKWGRAGGPELLRMSFGRFGDDIARCVSDATLGDWACEDLRTVFGINPDPIGVLVHRWIDALPQYGPGHGGLAAEVRAGLPPGLAVAGNYLDGVGVPACVAAAGRAAVTMLAGACGAGGPWHH